MSQENFKPVAEKIMFIAAKHQNEGQMVSSAILCLADGNALFSAGRYVDAANRYLDSLKYSVGVFHSDFKKAKAISFGQLDAE